MGLRETGTKPRLSFSLFPWTVSCKTPAAFFICSSSIFSPFALLPSLPPSLSYPHPTSHLADKGSRWEESSGRGGGASGDGPHGNGSGPSIPSLLSMATRSHMDITTPPLPQVSAEVLRVAEHRHRRGLMYPQIYHILTKVTTTTTPPPHHTTTATSTPR